MSVYPDINSNIVTTTIPNDVPIKIEAKTYVPFITTYNKMANCNYSFGIGHKLYKINEDGTLLDPREIITDSEIRNKIMHHYKDYCDTVTYNGINVLQYFINLQKQQQQQQQQQQDIQPSAPTIELINKE